MIFVQKIRCTQVQTLAPLEENTNNKGNIPRNKARGQTFTISKNLKKWSKRKRKTLKFILEKMSHSNMHDMYQRTRSYELDQMLKEKGSRKNSLAGR